MKKMCIIFRTMSGDENYCFFFPAKEAAGRRPWRRFFRFQAWSKCASFSCRTGLERARICTASSRAFGTAAAECHGARARRRALKGPITENPVRHHVVGHGMRNGQRGVRGDNSGQMGRPASRRYQHFSPLAAAMVAYWRTISGERCALITCTSCETPNLSNASARP